MLALQDIQTSRFQTASGKGTASSEFLEMLGDVITELMNRGDWAETLFPLWIPICPISGCVTWPNFVGEVRAMNLCRRGRAEMRNVFWEFLEGAGRRREFGGWGLWERWLDREIEAEYRYRVPIFQEIPGAGYNLRLAITESVDTGATATVFGTDNNGQPLQQQNGDGTWSPGITVVAASPYGSNPQLVSTINRVILTKTSSTKTLQAYNATSGNLVTLAEYAASETNPSFLRFKLQGVNPCCTGKCTSVLALIKWRVQPILNPTDYIPIDNREALLDGFKAARRSDADDIAGAQAFWRSAIEKMNRMTENSAPDDTFSAARNTFGDGRCFTNRCF